MITNYELRKNAREQLGGNIFASNWLWLLLVFLVYSAITAASASVVIGPLILTGPMLYGVSRVTTNTVRGKNVNIVEEFCGFTENFGSSIILYLLQTLFTLLWSLLFFIPGIVKSYAYSMAFYIMQDDRSKTATECLNESQELMRGNKWRLFCLDLSFIGWYIVGSFVFGIGTLFVVPYHQTARANFYMSLIAEKTVSVAE